MKYSTLLEALLIIFGEVVCRIFGHAKPDSTVAAYEEDHITHWQCPRCGGGAHGSWSGGA